MTNILPKISQKSPYKIEVEAGKNIHGVLVVYPQFNLSATVLTRPIKIQMELAL